MLQVIVKFDEKDTIVTIGESYLLFKLWRPGSALVRPITLPLTGAPWITQLEKFELFALVLNLVDGHH